MFPLAARVPHPLAQAVPVRFQLTVVAGFPEPVTCAANCWEAPVSTLALVGEIVTRTLLSIVTVPEPLAVESAWLVAVIVTVGVEGKTVGAA